MRGIRKGIDDSSSHGNRRYDKPAMSIAGLFKTLALFHNQNSKAGLVLAGPLLNSFVFQPYQPCLRTVVLKHMEGLDSPADWAGVLGR